MNRPKGLLLTAWIMVALMVAGWVRMYFWPHHAHLAHPPAYFHVVTAVIVFLFNITSFVFIFYYVSGRNWARIIVLLSSILSILYLPFLLRHDETPGQILSVAWALLGVFLLYWLNTHSVREFFKRRAPSTPYRIAD
jgi:peptidoglycan/LPS O-acetylase OafA/YrhL